MVTIIHKNLEKEISFLVPKTLGISYDPQLKPPRNNSFTSALLNVMRRLSVIVCVFCLAACRSYKQPQWTRIMQIPDPSDTNLQKLSNVNKLPRRIKKSTLFKQWYLTSDSARFASSKHNLSLVLDLGYDKTKKLGYMLLRTKRDKATSGNVCELFQVIDDSLHSNTFFIPDSVNTWEVARPGLLFGNIKLFGGKIATKKQARKMHREFSKKNKPRTP